MSAASSIALIVGLGNPGARFQNTWHNLGFLALDLWAERRRLAFKPGRGDCHHLKCTVAGAEIVLLKPTPYMNVSGVPVAKALRRLNLSPENLLVICDDVALPLGTLRIRKSGSDGGHRGLASIISEVGSAEIPRLRIGIFTETWAGELADYVLTSIPHALAEQVQKVLTTTADALDSILHRGLTPAMNLYNKNILTSSD